MNVTPLLYVLWFFLAVAIAGLFVIEGKPAQTLVWGFSAVVAATFFWKSQGDDAADA
ncbi:hypothetical protein [Haloprofundus marisrubri]|uniref:hypothetical protein n=1 Tax=Haloprofundus marisrubri TaxID=1514971 RepID=UPI0012BA6770|nr:hypothetical protein [Haloprofundus marisrubri]